MLNYLNLDKVVVDDDNKPAFVISSICGEKYITPLHPPQIEIRKIPTNLVNWNNNCFISAMLQCIFWNKSLLNTVINSTGKPKSSKLIGTLFKFIAKTKRRETVKQKYIELLKQFNTDGIWTIGDECGRSFLIEFFPKLKLSKHEKLLFYVITFLPEMDPPSPKIIHNISTRFYIEMPIRKNLTKINELLMPTNNDAIFICKYPEIAIVCNLRGKGTTPPPYRSILDRKTNYWELTVFGVLVNTGNHFISYLKIDGSNDWYKMNDSLLSLSPITVNNKSAVETFNSKETPWMYIFYKKVNIQRK